MSSAKERKKERTDVEYTTQVTRLGINVTYFATIRDEAHGVVK